MKCFCFKTLLAASVLGVLTLGLVGCDDEPDSHDKDMGSVGGVKIDFMGDSHGGGLFRFKDTNTDDREHSR